MKKILVLIPVITILFAITALAADCGGSTTCSCGDSLTSSRILNESDSLTGCTGSGLAITADNVALDCNGTSISGNSNGVGNGVYINGGLNNVTVRNCTIYGFTISSEESGIYVNSGTNHSILHNTIYNNGYGIYSNANTRIEFNVINNSQAVGINLESSFSGIINGNNLSYATAFAQSSGIYLSTTGAVNITNNSIYSNDRGIYISSAPNTKIWNNNIYSNSPQYNIWSSSAFEASYNGEGNYWGHSTCPLFSAGVDSNSANVKDSYALNDTFENGGVHLACCGDTITASTTLINDLAGCSVTALNINASDVELDCDSYSISGDYSTAGTKGVQIFSGKNNVTVKNCIIYGFNSSTGYGIYGSLGSTEDINVLSNTLYDNGAGIGLTATSAGSNNYIISNNIIFNTTRGTSPGAAIFVQNSGNASVANNKIYSSAYYGLYFFSSGTILNNFFNRSSYYGMIVGSPSCDIRGNNVSYSTRYGISIYDSSQAINITENNLNNNGFQGLALTSATANIDVWHNNIYSNNGGNQQVTSFNSIELSNGSEGNYWGHSTCPVFVAGTDSNSAGVVDSYPYRYLDGWLAYSPADCILPNGSIMSPLSGDYINGNTLPYTINGTAEDAESGIDDVDIIINGVTIGTAFVTAGYWEYSWSPSDSIYNVTAQINDNDQNHKNYTVTNVTVDSSVPTITEPPTSVVTTTSDATINFSADEEVIRKAYYGTNSSNLSSETSWTSTYELSGTVSIGGLAQNTLYYYRLSVCDHAGNCDNSSTFNFTTQVYIPPEEPVQSSSRGGGGTSAIMPYSGKTAENIINSGEEIVQSLILYGVYSYRLGSGGLLHKIVVKEINYKEKTTVLEFESERITETFEEGETKQIDLDNDGKEDIEVSVPQVKEKSVEIKVGNMVQELYMPETVEIKEEAPVEKAEVPQVAEAPEAEEGEVVEETNWVQLIVILAIVAAGLLIIIFSRRKHRNRV
ncbi:right-handed parallel beta-helix repeat-containing protein [Candidatus Woesearchaeota archaeon]|nr:right-handed parallel beta-helix repeat-containing protein [Candidatus Woesearchaeota archaeon]